MRKITDPMFVYRNSAETDVAATFRRVRKELKAQEEARAATQAETAGKVKILNRSKS